MNALLPIAALIASLALLIAASAYALELWAQRPQRLLWEKPEQDDQPTVQETQSLRVDDDLPGPGYWLRGQIID